MTTISSCSSVCLARPAPAETSAPRVPHFDEPDPAGQEAFGLFYGLLGYNLRQMGADTTATQTVANVTDELVRPPAPLLAASPDSSNASNQKLRQLNDSFRNSRHAIEADALADAIRLDSVTYESFHRNLQDLFAQGYSIEAFVTLVHFLARLLVRCFQESGRDAFKELCRCLLRWFLAFLLRELLSFVVQYIRSLSSAEPSSFALGCVVGAGAASAAFLLCLYLWRKR